MKVGGSVASRSADVKSGPTGRVGSKIWGLVRDSQGISPLYAHLSDSKCSVVLSACVEETLRAHTLLLAFSPYKC